MKRNVTAVLLVFMLVGFLSLFPRDVPAQETDALAGKILNPLPEFDPFEAPPAAPQFFPDQIDKKAREVLIDALTHRTEALKDHWRFFKAQDSALTKERNVKTGLTEHVLDLMNNSIEDRERYLAAEKRALDEASSPERKKYLESIVKHDDLNQADELLRKSSANRWGGFLNRFLSSVDLVSVVSGSYVGAAVDSTMSQLFALAEKEMPIQERKALARYLDHLKRYPHDPHNPEIWKRVDALEKKKKDALVQKQLNEADDAAANGNFERALFHRQLAALLNPGSREAPQEVEQTEELLHEKEAVRQQALTAAVEKNLPAEESRDISGLLQVLTLREPERIREQAAELERKYRGKPLADSARDAAAVALETEGRYEKAKKVIEQLARSSEDPQERERAAALLASPEYNLLASFRGAQSDRRLETVKYVLLGEDLLRKNLLYATGPLVASGPAGAATLGAANVIMIGTNLFQVLTTNPVSSQSVIDKGVAYIRSHPQSESASEVYRVLAEAYEERGMFDRAIRYYAMSGAAEPEKMAALKDRAGKALLNAAARSGARSSQQYYLKTVLDEYPESAAAEEATRKLASLARSENQGLRMSKQFLMENPELYGPQGLGLKASLFDGNVHNMELDKHGVTLTSDREILLHYETPWGSRSQDYRLPKQSAERFFMALRQKNHAVAMADADRRAKGSVGGIMNVPMALLKGKTETKAEQLPEEGDATLKLVRRAGGPAPDFPKVLDHELLSENERNPASKYKLPPVQGSISASRFALSGALPTGLWGNRLSVGTDHKSPFTAVQLPIPLLEGFIPVDFMLQGRPGGFSVFPKIHTFEDGGEDQELYR